MKKITFLFLVLFFTTLSANSQEVLLEENVKETFDDDGSGPNQKNFFHPYLDFGFYIQQPEGETADIVYGLTNTFTFGFRYKRKLTNFYSLGFGFYYNNRNFKFKQNETKIFPSVTVHESENLKFNSLGAELYNRFNFDINRGDIIGKYLDVAAYIDWMYTGKRVIKDEINVDDAIPGGETTKTIIKDLNYVEDIAYGVRARLGWNKWSITASYRLSDLINNKFPETEMPRLSIGVQMGLHR